MAVVGHCRCCFSGKSPGNPASANKLIRFHNKVCSPHAIFVPLFFLKKNLLSMRFLITLFVLAPTALFAQGIHFETGNWKAVLAKAKAQNRMVYVDAYTTWCGPCKVLERTVFPQKEAGDKYNSLFVNYRLDAEKGEGIAFKKKYRVTAFPSHLFINPKTEEIVYRTTGAGGVALFNQNADVALEEAADPMTWDLYAKSFAAGTRDPRFLKAYLLKAARLKQNNDAILNAYIAPLDKAALPDSTLYFLEDNTRTIWNDAVPILAANRARLATRDTGEHYYGYGYQVDRWLYPSYEVARDAKDEQQLSGLVSFIQANISDGAEADNQIFFYRKRYYEETEDSVKGAAVAAEEVALMASKPLAYFSVADAKAREDMESGIRYQLKSMTLPEGTNLDTLVAKNMAQNAGAFPSVRAAELLNSAAWKTYENKKATAADLQEALKWSGKAMAFSQSYPEYWAAFADTHASLLYRTGQKEEAFLTEAKAIKALQGAGKKEDADRYEQTLQKMKSGTY